jgi:hypothetical protein
MVRIESFAPLYAIDTKWFDFVVFRDDVIWNKMVMSEPID